MALSFYLSDFNIYLICIINVLNINFIFHKLIVYNINIYTCLWIWSHSWIFTGYTQLVLLHFVQGRILRVNKEKDMIFQELKVSSQERPIITSFKWSKEVATRRQSCDEYKISFVNHRDEVFAPEDADRQRDYEAFDYTETPFPILPNRSKYLTDKPRSTLTPDTAER